MNITIWQTIFLALLQGVTELFPVSSLGHTVILPGLLPQFFPPGFASDTSCGGHGCFLPLVTALHLGTSIALVIYFWRDWLQVCKTILSSLRNRRIRKDTEEWVGWLIIVGCIPGGLLGVALESALKKIFASPVLAAAFLVLNGSILFAGEAMRKRAEARRAIINPKESEASFRPLSSLGWKEAFVVGCAQSLALIPGISRSGVTMVAGLGVRLSHEDAARYSFLLGTPLIAAAGLLEIPRLLGQSTSTWLIIITGAALSGIAAFLSTKFLTKYFENGRLTPFAIYCWTFGLISLVLLFMLHAG
ncbi:MAG TPA: undecaprenyl-diphosphate phosphatase [Ktedonobacteraceae bacterium]|nr:undecaprenyl-diphosphate phosphatase [Ktedonobacteraceae bacterium]